MEKGHSYFSVYELLFLSYVYGLTPTTHVGVFTLFPIIEDFLKTTTIGVKQNYLRSNNLGAALWVTYTPKIEGLMLGNVLSIGKPSNGIHLGLGAATGLDTEDDGNERELIYMVGYRADLSQRFSFIVEYHEF